MNHVKIFNDDCSEFMGTEEVKLKGQDWIDSAPSANPMNMLILMEKINALVTRIKYLEAS